MSDLRRAAASGVRWAALSQVCRQAIVLGALVLLTRIVGPDNVGLLAMAFTVTGFVDLFRDLGTGAAIIQRRAAGEGLRSSVFWLNLVVGALCAAGVFAGAPLAGAYFREPAVVPLLRLLSLSFVIAGLGVVHLALLQRAIAFRALAVVEVGSAAVGAAVGIGLALRGFGALSLAGQSLAAVATSTALAWAAEPWRPRLRIVRAELAAISGFSGGLVGFNVANYFIRNADYALIGRYLGATSLGVYTLAYRLILLPQQQLALVVNRVMLPVLARLDDRAAFRGAYLRLVGLIALLATPAFALMFALAEPLVSLFFGPEWLPAAPLLAILAPVGLFQCLSGSTGLIYQARARTDLLLRWGLAAGAITVAGFVVGLRWGVIGVATAYAVVTLLTAYPAFALPFGLIELRWTDFGRVLAPALICGALSLAVVAALRPLTAGLPAVLVVPGLAGVGAGLYLGLSLRLNRAALDELVAVLRRP